MNRHHPYGGIYDGPRRGGPPPGPGPGPDRSHGRFSERGGFRGRGRGRGGGGAFGGSNDYYGGGAGSYEQNTGPPSYDSSTPDSYSQWNNPPEVPYYGQNAGYGGNFSAPYNEPATVYEQPKSGNYEDGPTPISHRGGRGGRRGGPRREREEKIPDSVIEERIQREKPCRTLFIRNIKYETDSNDVRHQFAEFGEIKTFFDLISTRGMVFVTYYDLRAAERARERLQDTEISGRPIDVHYSLPRADETKEGRERNQGTVLVTLTNSMSGQPIDDNEVRHKFQQFGDVKSVRPGENPHNQRYVEFFDVRACEDAFDRLRHQGLQDGVMDIIFASDFPDAPAPAGPPQRRPLMEERGRGGARDHDEHGPHRARRGGRGQRGRGSGPREDWERRDDWSRDRDRGRNDDDYRGGGGGRGRGSGFGGRGGDYGGPSPAPGNFPPPPPAQPPVAPLQPYAQPNGATLGGLPTDDRLEQARKVQQLLAALKQPAASAAPPSGPPAPQPQLPPSGPPIPGAPYYPPPPPSTMQHTPQSYPGVPTAMPPYGMPGMPPSQHPSAGTQPSPATPSTATLASLPPNVLAMLQQAASAASAPPAPQYGMPPSQQPSMHTNNANTLPTDYQQLVAYLQSQAGKQA